MSWDEVFADRYEEWSAQMTADVAFYVGLAREADGPVVELAVGNGRVAIPVARETGRRVVGIDSSPTMLGKARVRAAEAGVELDLRDGDMRDLDLDEPAALIYCPFRALLHLPTWVDRRRTFERWPLATAGRAVRVECLCLRPPVRRTWLGLIDVAGLELAALYAGFDREPFTEDSREYVFVARR
jgi:trans-aconitate methyltransferase